MVKVIQKFTRLSLHDMFWFELPQTVEEQKMSDIFVNRSVDTYHDDSSNTKEEIRPDILDMIRLGEFTYDEASYLGDTTCKIIFIFNNIEEFRQANRDLFDSIGEIILTKAKQTNNTIQEKVYDENDVFIENGLFNQE
jgi:hypothetical protein